MQAAFFLLACFSGSRLVWLMNRGNWLKVIQQASGRFPLVAEMLNDTNPSESTNCHLLDLCSCSAEASTCNSQSCRRHCIWLVLRLEAGTLGLEAQHAPTYINSSVLYANRCTSHLITNNLHETYITRRAMSVIDGIECLLDNTPQIVLSSLTRTAPFTSAIIRR